MIELKNEIDRAIETCSSLLNHGGEHLPAKEIRMQFESSNRIEWVRNYHKYINMSVNLGPEFTMSISELIVNKMGKFVNIENASHPMNGEIGLGYRYLVADYYKNKGKINNFKVKDFAEDIVDASIVFGSASIINLLEKWNNFESEPLSFSIKGKILGIHVTESTDLAEGVKIEPEDKNALDQEVSIEYLVKDGSMRSNF